MRFFKNTIIALLLVTVLIQTFATLGVIVQFETNRSYYAEVLCINKNRPELACHGKCILMQRLNFAYEKEQKTTNQALKNLLDYELTLFCQRIDALNLNNRLSFPTDKAVANFYSQNHFPQPYCTGIFHPPTVMV